MEVLGEKCGVFGVYGADLDAARLAFFGLYALQHRGQESSGIAVSDGRKLTRHVGMGLVSQVYTEADIEKLQGHIAIGHNRYSTMGGSVLEHGQPAFAHPSTRLGASSALALAHNGNLPSTKLLEEFLARRGVEAAGLSDSRMIAEAIACHLADSLAIEDAIARTFPLMTGAFSILILTPTKLIALRDAYGIRPLCFARFDGGYVFASESCAFHPIGATYERDVRPGEMLVIDSTGVHSRALAKGREQLDIFEFVYFARPDSELLGQSVYETRRRAGEELAREAKVAADIVVPVPETAIPVAIGYAATTGIPLEMALVKNRYIHRTFIAPEQHIREQGVKLKLTPLPEIIRDKRIAVIDDSVVRGTTSKQIVAMLFEAGAKAVHFLLASPPVKFPDFYGIDTPNQKKLLAASHSREEMRSYLGATTLHFLSLAGLIKAIGVSRDRLCTSCFTGDYPIDLLERTKEVNYSV
ncbi:amidophosphoribosyltransferase [Candidatus Kaiserbacteria bacterium]|nr:amidophosphoribosyltransferase [Candidatus Kaiserbacteria bacterium]